MNPRTHRPGRRSALLMVVAFLVAAVSAAPHQQADALLAYQRISGEGSSWAANALEAMRVNVQSNKGMVVDYNPSGSSAGRKNFLNGTVDFAASDIPFQFRPEDGSAPENPAPDSYAYIPVVAGGTSFMYNLKINGKRVTNLRLSGENVVKIFTGKIKMWNDAAIQADNPGIVMPARAVVPVVRSDGSGSSAQFTKWMITQYPALWTEYCNTSGRAPACGFTSFYPTITGMIAQSGDLGVAGYISQGFAEGAIGYVNYSYALGSAFPVAKVLNAAGYYTEPTPKNVAVSLLKAQINTDASDPAVYLTQKLEGVYTDTDPRNYQLSSYSYLIVPTKVAGQFNEAKGKTLGDFAYYAMCEAQQQSESLGYSPMPINLVQASFDQIMKIPGVVAREVDISACNNPTFSANGTNTLATKAPQPQACDKKGYASQCPNGTGGMSNVQTAVKAVATTGGGSTVTTVKAGGTKPPAGSATGDTGPVGTDTGTVDTVPTGDGTGDQVCDPTVSDCSGGGGSSQDGPSAAEVGAISPSTLDQASGWTVSTALLLLVIGLTLVLILAPALVWRHLANRGNE